ncbi:UNVERIFIED_CONTAM: Retrovirus-related Pol polyprotein from transposon RE1 [Sesamum radiatum]|uniref:Retrovirus-related Pol polyprotein from transposon RE1 n=1 Tax=Sesamum radiatum TaxID=300843 RepID=A0AAW2SMJ8_SESRA
MPPPKGYLRARPGQVCRLKRSLYGLKQASRQWNIELTSKLESHGFTRSPHDHYFFTKDCNVLNARATATPFPPGIKFDNSTGALLSSPDRYRRIVGRLLYLGFLRPDISFAVQQLSQFLQHPRVPHWDAAIYLLRYLKGTPNLGLFFPANTSLQLCAYSDSDWASCPDSRRSLTGYCVFLGGALISWKTKKQATVSRSSAEAEYRSMASTVCELLWIRYLLHEFRIPPLLPIPFWCDNKAAIHIAENPVFHERTQASRHRLPFGPRTI